MLPDRKDDGGGGIDGVFRHLLQADGAEDLILFNVTAAFHAVHAKHLLFCTLPIVQHFFSFVKGRTANNLHCVQN